MENKSKCNLIVQKAEGVKCKKHIQSKTSDQGGGEKCIEDFNRIKSQRKLFLKINGNKLTHEGTAYSAYYLFSKSKK